MRLRSTMLSASLGIFSIYSFWKSSHNNLWIRNPKTRRSLYGQPIHSDIGEASKSPRGDEKGGVCDSRDFNVGGHAGLRGERLRTERRQAQERQAQERQIEGDKDKD